VEHVAIWASDLESMRAFYTSALGGTSGDLYQNPSTGFSSYFVSFGDGARVELMNLPGVLSAPFESPASQPAAGFAHIALTLDTREAVDAAVASLRCQGVSLASEPRTTGDGYYEAVIRDPEGNLIELAAGCR
jgi:lactoylglutathione lyase